MNLNQLITPKNEDGSIDHRYQPISKEICSLAGEKCLAKLKEFHEKTSHLEKEHANAALHLVRKSFQIEMDEYQRKRVTKALTTALKELGFKPSKVTKLINAGRFLQTYEWFEELRFYFGPNSEITGSEGYEKISEHLEGFGIGSLDVLSRTTKHGRKKAYQHYVKQGTRMSQKALENLQHQYPTNLDETRGKKRNHANFQGAHTTPELKAHESLEIMDDAVDESVIESPECGQKLIKEFFQLFVSGKIEHRLAEFTPTAQAHLIDEIKAGIPLLEEFVAKNKTIEVASIH